MSQRDLVSVVIPAHNYGHFIGATLESVLSQSYERLECVVVDDGSSDDTRQVVEGYAGRDARVRYVHQSCRGVAAARNNGLRQARGEFFQFLDADDLIEPRKVELQVEYLVAHPRVDIVYGSARYFRTEHPAERRLSLFDERAQSSHIPQLSADGGDALKTLLRVVMPVNTALVRRRVVESVEPFDSDLDSVEDWDYWVRCAARGFRFQYHDAEGTLALIRSHAGSLTKRRINALKKTLRMREKLARSLDDPEALLVNRAMSGECEGYLGLEEVSAGNPLRGARHLLKASLRGGDGAKGRVKWAMCAVAAPFVGEERRQKLPATPLSQWARLIFAAPERGVIKG